MVWLFISFTYIVSHMQKDIENKIKKDFGEFEPEAIEIFSYLNRRTLGLMSDRMIRSIIFLADGKVSRLNKIIEHSRSSYRDILTEAENDNNSEQIYNFKKSFYEMKLL